VARVGVTTARESRGGEGRGAAHDVHFKQSDEISNQRHATASHAVLVFLQRVRERRGGGHQMEANAKGAVEWSYLTQAQTLRRCIPKLLIGKYPLASRRHAHKRRHLAALHLYS
jgi:hypothetical protein